MKQKPTTSAPMGISSTGNSSQKVMRRILARKAAKTETALSTFEQRKAQILERAARLVANLEAYDREISGYPGGHGNWGHAGTLANILDKLAECEEALASARENTRAGAAKGAR